MDNVVINGKVETVASDRDIVDIIRDNCGDDFADYVNARLNGYRHEYTQEEIENVLSQTDYYSYEASLDDWTCVGNDITEECEKQIEYIENAKRINKDDLWSSFKYIMDRIMRVC